MNYDLNKHYFLLHMLLIHLLFYFKIEEVDMNKHLTEIPFGAYQLSLVILNNALLKKDFSSNAVAILSSDVYENVRVHLY